MKSTSASTPPEGTPSSSASDSVTSTECAEAYQRTQRKGRHRDTEITEETCGAAKPR